MFDPARQAAAAARNAHDVPEEVLKGTPLGVCRDCGARFEYGVPDVPTDNLDPCPECGSQNWAKWGYRVDGETVPTEEVGEEDV